LNWARGAPILYFHGLGAKGPAGHLNVLGVVLVRRRGWEGAGELAIAGAADDRREVTPILCQICATNLSLSHGDLSLR